MVITFLNALLIKFKTGNNIPLENISHLLAGEQEIEQVPNNQTLRDIERSDETVSDNSWKLSAAAIHHAMTIYLTEGNEAAACIMYRSASEIVCSLLRAAFKLFHDQGESVPLRNNLKKSQKKNLIKNLELHASFRNIYLNRFVGSWGAKYMLSQK
ncbi:hypothetical protein PHYBLDRAFT_144229 [Phycomyces blakesleeanus NRRL 1555(-)]|uniref:Uncharacterized protein n=1 Tax=Phycomyces blakesleeanus (strain ATCC 8743b / DSM 1359 / FGSC 10004 / NBRC 33097 / NRRL 1555) TaxID=763407 RepID=A0A163APD4_PHYB8|nr:hypothetical protein PHYBLDRAFT_144229 [Phycomyces blakesleeanus NRRL 1555(-)]OAD74871.1 hypothetical protein PHYBLDRAFT_144229 [Phycomyces blakesleeanus NRRL 1555(-)]|eukprot:XP_018292911.1 hypothetical protein PHYBLDRAFT_144229 [Phycomyces blakesleeanus NRRL 1555(-)]